MWCIGVLIDRFDDAHPNDMAEMTTVARCVGSGRDRAPARDRSVLDEWEATTCTITGIMGRLPCARSGKPSGT